MSRLHWLLAALLLSTGLVAQDGDRACGPEEPTLYFDSEGASGATLLKRYAWGNTRELEVTARLRTAFAEPATGVQGYSISVEHTEWPFVILDVTVDGLNDIAAQGFAKTEIIKVGPRRGFVSTALLCNCSLPPTGDFPLARVKYFVEFGAETAPFLEFAGRIEYADGLQVSGGPVRNTITVGGETLVPCVEPLDVTVKVGNTGFVRGDSNDDGAVDISDPVNLLRSLFQGDAVVPCADAGDANDDGFLDVSDAVYVLRFLFQNGPAPHMPFPGTGWDLTWDELGCFPEASG